MAKKILILTASPLRDEPIDLLIAAKLRVLGNEVFVRPCLREGRQAILEIQPNVVIVPPVRNPYSRDFVQTIKAFGCACITRHTEPSCDWTDFKAMKPEKQQDIMGKFPYVVDLEIVWGPDEAQILNQRKTPFQAVSVGSLAVDVYKDVEIVQKYISREVFCQKNKFDLNKKTILILSAWGFLDSSPDLFIDEQFDCQKDKEGRKIWLEMITKIHEKFKDKFNILVTLHPNVDVIPYKEVLDPKEIPINTESKAVELVKNSDVVIHAGSTTALGSHFLNKPAIQYGDQNAKGFSWWNRAESPISHVSPYAKDIDELIKLVESIEFDKSNASVEAIANLEKGRYGLMDGKATERAAELINKLDGKFNYIWPDLGRDYSQLLLKKQPSEFCEIIWCNICKRPTYIAKTPWVNQLAEFLKIDKSKFYPAFDTCCVNCGARFMRTDYEKLKEQK